MNYQEEYKDCLDYIDTFWDKVTVKPKSTDYLFNVLKKKSQKRMHKNILQVPHAFIVPNDKKFTHVFYWDTFFMFRGLIRTKREWLLKSMVDNFIYLYNKYGIIPNFNSPASTGRSQPPFFTSMILDTYNGPYFAYLKKNFMGKLFFSNMDYYRRWLEKAVAVAKREYNHVWMDPNSLFYHYVKEFDLNKYGDRDIGYAHSSELESGWDFTSRFYNRCNEFLPIDLNAFLFKYERDFAKFAFHLKNKKDRKYWQEIADTRKERINKLMWNEKEGFFFDYGFVHKKQSNFLSLAGFTPLWAGMATEAQAKQMVKKLKVFETEYGLTITAKESLAPQIDLSTIPERYRPALEEVIKPKQWDFPHSWPPLEYLTAIGLLRYGYVDDSVRIMKKFLRTHSALFRKYKTFFEKIDAITGEPANNFHYTTQSGFGWTNAAFFRFVEILTTIEKNEPIYQTPKESHAPYKIIIPH